MQETALSELTPARNLGWAGLGWARVYINTNSAVSRDSIRIQRMLLHEFGHVVGLGHPDEAGQNVEAVMNSRVIYNTLQPDDIAGLHALYPPPTRLGMLENPGPGSFQSGLGLISGWVCEAQQVMIEINGPEQEAAYGTERGDTAQQCGDTDNGFGLLFNWNLLGDGQHTVTAFADGIRLGQATVTTLGEEFLRGAFGAWTIDNFPDSGQSVTIEWSEELQNFVITHSTTPPYRSP